MAARSAARSSGGSGCRRRPARTGCRARWSAVGVLLGVGGHPQPGPPQRHPAHGLGDPGAVGQRGVGRERRVGGGAAGDDRAPLVDPAVVQVPVAEHLVHGSDRPATAGAAGTSTGSGAEPVRTVRSRDAAPRPSSTARSAAVPSTVSSVSPSGVPGHAAQPVERRPPPGGPVAGRDGPRRRRGGAGTACRHRRGSGRRRCGRVAVGRARIGVVGRAGTVAGHGRS